MLLNDFRNEEIPSTSRLLTIMRSDEVEHNDEPDWEEAAVNCSFIAKAVYYVSKKNGNNIVTTDDILEWLNKLHYKIEADMVVKMLSILSSTGVIIRHNEHAKASGWEWQLKD